MNYNLIKDVIDLISDFEKSQSSPADLTVENFKQWISANYEPEYTLSEPLWEGKENGRSAESVINTLIVHMNRYAKSYSKAAIFDSNFSTQEDFIYLITLRAFGKMSKMDLIKRNVQEKPAGMQIINRLIAQGWVQQTDSHVDKRSKLLDITQAGHEALNRQMANIRKATHIVTGDLTYAEKMELIRLLQKLDHFHQPIYDRGIEPRFLLDEAMRYKNKHTT